MKSNIIRLKNTFHTVKTLLVVSDDLMSLPCLSTSGGREIWARRKQISRTAGLFFNKALRKQQYWLQGYRTTALQPVLWANTQGDSAHLCTVSVGLGDKMRQVLIIFVVVAGIFGSHFSVSAQAEALKAEILPPVVTENINKLAALCKESGCIKEDFFPVVLSQGVILSEVAIYWQRGGEKCATFVSQAGAIVIDMGQNGIFIPYGLAGESFVAQNVCHAYVTLTPQGGVSIIPNPIEVPPSRTMWCGTCGNIEYFPWNTTPGERIAYTKDYTPVDIAVPGTFVVFAWRAGILETYFGPGTVHQLPFHHSWWEVYPFAKG